MTLTEFLLARIAEDEANADCISDSCGYWYTARVLAECEAKRRIVEMHPLDPTEVHSWGTVGGGCNLCDHDCTTGGGTIGDGPCDTLRALALPYADHPDYQQEWAA